MPPYEGVGDGDGQGDWKKIGGGIFEGVGSSCEKGILPVHPIGEKMGAIFCFCFEFYTEKYKLLFQSLLKE